MTKNPFWRLLKLAAPFKGWIALATLLGVSTVGSGIGLMATSAYLISSAALHPSVAALSLAIVGVRFFGISRGIFRYLERYVSHQVTFKLLARLRVWFYEAIEPLAPARLLEGRYRSGDLLSRVVADIETLQDFYGRVLAPPLVAAIVGLGMWFFLGAYAVNLALIFLAFFLMAGVGVPLLTYRLSRKLSREVITVRAELNVEVVDGLQGLAEVVAFGQEEKQFKQVQALNRKLIYRQQQLSWVNGLQNGLGNLLMNLAAWAMLWGAIPLVQEGGLEGIYLALLILAALASFEAVLPLPMAFQHLGSSLEAARRLFEIVDSPPIIHEPKTLSPTPRNYSIEVKNLCFQYEAEGVGYRASGDGKEEEYLAQHPTPDTRHPIPDTRCPTPNTRYAVDNISFTLPEGQCLALVGPSGAGKSTLANLLLRFWDYSEGQIRLGGYELRDYSQADLHKLCGVVTQTTHLFNTTIRENLLIARPDATPQELITATTQAHIHDFIQTLPLGYDTLVGEEGLRLSAGERQRIAIARALLKNAPILILDEATANLDTITEREIWRTLQTLRQGRTTMIITHQLSGLEMADEILVLRAGKMVERGPHYELLSLEGFYWRMWLNNR